MSENTNQTFKMVAASTAYILRECEVGMEKHGFSGMASNTNISTRWVVEHTQAWEWVRESATVHGEQLFGGGLLLVPGSGHRSHLVSHETGARPLPLAQPAHHQNAQMMPIACRSRPDG